MGSRWQFEIMTEDDARAVLRLRTDQAEIYNDKIRAHQTLVPKTTAAEREANRRWLEAWPALIADFHAKRGEREFPAIRQDASA